jgi:hypothetical protein
MSDVLNIFFVQLKCPAFAINQQCGTVSGKKDKFITTQA